MWYINAIAYKIPILYHRLIFLHYKSVQHNPGNLRNFKLAINNRHKCQVKSFFIKKYVIIQVSI